MDPKANKIVFSGDRYLYSGQHMPELMDWIQRVVSMDFSKEIPEQKDMEIDAPRNVNHDFLKDLALEKCFSRLSFEKWERIMHSHGASLREVFALRYGKFDRYVDVVVYPTESS